MTLTPTGPNAEQIRYWNEVNAEKWIRFQGVIDEQIRSLGRAAMERVAMRSGERALDVGCGCGDTTLEIAHRVGPAGFVVGLDVSAPMLAEAERRARERSVSNARFLNADAQTHTFSAAGFDVGFSRFGVMFFADPARAFANLGHALRPGGRFAFVCWQAIDRNPWMGVPMAAAARESLPAAVGPAGPGSVRCCRSRSSAADLDRRRLHENRHRRPRADARSADGAASMRPSNSRADGPDRERGRQAGLPAPRCALPSGSHRSVPRRRRREDGFGHGSSSRFAHSIRPAWLSSQPAWRKR